MSDTWYLLNTFRRESNTVVDWTRVCRECARFPNRCDHVGIMVLHIRVTEAV